MQEGGFRGFRGYVSADYIELSVADDSLETSVVFDISARRAKNNPANPLNPLIIMIAV
jgi:hypothetical protein